VKFNFQRRLSESTVLKTLKILPARDQKRIILVTVIQVCLGFLDLLGVAILGVVGALSVTGIQSLEPGNTVGFIIRSLGLSNFSFQQQVAFLAVGAASILILRTILSIIIARKTYYFLSRRSALITANLFSRLLSQSLLKVQEKSTQENLYRLTVGVSSLTLIVLGTFIALVADVSLTLVMLIGLLIFNPLIAMQTLVFFGAIGFILYRLTSVRAHRLGYLDSQLTVASNNLIIEALALYRESIVRNRRSYYAQELKKIRHEVSNITAEMQFMPNVSKYVFESGMVVGAILIAGTQFVFQNAQQAIAALSVFLAAGTRIAPAIMRIQQNLIQVRRGIGSAMPTLEMIESLLAVPETSDANKHEIFTDRDFEAKIEVDSVSLIYPKASRSALDNISLSVNAGKSIALVGPSGAGKTSIVDVILGVIPANSGTVRISGVHPLEAIARWPGSIAYVPQNVLISEGTIRSNVALGFPLEDATDESIWGALEVAQLSDFVRSLPGGIDQPVGENGTKISGGQRQRLGIARAMFTNPKLLVLDEATSSLDGQTESDFSSSLAKLDGDVTLVIIAHRLSTIREVDEVIYLDKGRVIARGTFREVRSQVPDFDSQANLIGL
jgi:ABC-type multidrug transport system fused ATPase/permease subunit